MRVFEVDLAASECLPRLKAYLNRHFNICLPYLDLIQTFVSHVSPWEVQRFTLSFI